MTSGGPDNGRLPTATDRNQIAYGVDSRVQSLLAVSRATHRVGFRRLAAMTAAEHGAALLRSAATTARAVDVVVPGTGPSVIEVYDSSGRLWARYDDRGGDATAWILPSGFTVIRR